MGEWGSRRKAEGSRQRHARIGKERDRKSIEEIFSREEGFRFSPHRSENSVCRCPWAAMRLAEEQAWISFRLPHHRPCACPLPTSRPGEVGRRGLSKAGLQPASLLATCFSAWAERAYRGSSALQRGFSRRALAKKATGRMAEAGSRSPARSRLWRGSTTAAFPRVEARG